MQHDKTEVHLSNRMECVKVLWDNMSKNVDVDSNPLNRRRHCVEFTSFLERWFESMSLKPNRIKIQKIKNSATQCFLGYATHFTSTGCRKGNWVLMPPPLSLVVASRWNSHYFILSKQAWYQLTCLRKKEGLESLDESWSKDLECMLWLCMLQPAIAPTYWAITCPFDA